MGTMAPSSAHLSVLCQSSVCEPDWNGSLCSQPLCPSEEDRALCFRRLAELLIVSVWLAVSV